MTREELIEVMARAICAGQGLDWKDQFSIWSSNGDPLAHEAFKHDATAALTALEAAGVRLVPVDPDDNQLAAGMESDSISHPWEALGVYRMMVSYSPYALKEIGQ